MAYVIQNLSTGKYGKLIQHRGSWTSILGNSTQFHTYEKAENFMKNNFRASFPGVPSESVLILDTENLLNEPENEELPKKFITPEEADETLHQMIEFYGSVVENTSQFTLLVKHYGSVVRQCEQETQDLLHKIEFTNENVVNGYKRYKQLQEVRKRRREAKDCLEFASLILSSGLISSLKQLNADVEKLKKHEEARTYTPRRLQELFDNQ